jgi:hypothetical protein
VLRGVLVQVGLFTYALFLGLVAEAVQSASDGFKKGNGEVVESGHTVIMHTNSNTKRFLRQVPHPACSVDFVLDIFFAEFWLLQQKPSSFAQNSLASSRQ